MELYISLEIEMRNDRFSIKAGSTNARARVHLDVFVCACVSFLAVVFIPLSTANSFAKLSHNINPFLHLLLCAMIHKRDVRDYLTHRSIYSDSERYHSTFVEYFFAAYDTSVLLLKRLNGYPRIYESFIRGDTPRAASRKAFSHYKPEASIDKEARGTAA